MPKIIEADMHQAALKRSVCLMCGWDASKIRMKNKRSEFWWDAGGMV
jgi:hypothetical protein